MPDVCYRGDGAALLLLCCCSQRLSWDLDLGGVVSTLRSPSLFLGDCRKCFNVSSAANSVWFIERSMLQAGLLKGEGGGCAQATGLISLVHVMLDKV